MSNGAPRKARMPLDQYNLLVEGQCYGVMTMDEARCIYNISRKSLLMAIRTHRLVARKGTGGVWLISALSLAQNFHDRIKEDETSE